ADAVRRLGELVGGLREGGGGGLRGAAAAGQRIGALADGGQRGGGGLRAAGNGACGPLELADHRAELELQQLKDGARRIVLIAGREGAICRRYRGSRALRRAL